MSEQKTKLGFWHWFGMIAAFGLAIYGSILLYSYLDDQRDPSISVEGDFHRFNMPPCEFELKPQDKAFQVDTLAGYLYGVENAQQIASQIYDYSVNTFPPKFSREMDDFKTLWWFKVRNTGNKGLADLSLEIPFSGKCLITWDGEESEFKEFNQNINIGHIYPSESIYVFAWSYEPLKDYHTYYPENTKLVFKGGTKKITYPVQSKGLVAWNTKHQNKPLIFLIAGVLVLLVAIMILFYNLGINSVPKNEETVIEFGKRTEPEDEASE